MEETKVTLNENERAAAEAVFGERLPLAERYVQHLATTGIDVYKRQGSWCRR